MKGCVKINLECNIPRGHLCIEYRCMFVVREYPQILPCCNTKPKPYNSMI